MRRVVLCAVGVASLGAILAAAPASVSTARDASEQATCLAAASGVANVRLDNGAGADTYDLSWMADPDLIGKRYVVQVADPESPLSLIAHDRIILPGAPADWVAAARDADLVLCHRKAPAIVVIRRQFCSGPLAASDMMNGEIEEIAFLAGTSWLADDLFAMIEQVPAEIAEDLRRELAAVEQVRAERIEREQVTVYGEAIERRVAAWNFVPMSSVLGSPTACFARHAALRARASGGANLASRRGAP
jgi:hypothetical protein